MKAKTSIIAIILFLFVAEAFAKKEKVIFNVDMSCMSCKLKIEKNISFEKGVKAMDVSFENKTVTITYDDSKTDIAKLQKGFKKINYQATVTEPKLCNCENASTECKNSCVKSEMCSETCKTKKCNIYTRVDKL